MWQSGLTEISFEYEPVAAAHHYEQGLDRDELVLIADFGGGTSDFCLLRVGPSLRGRARTRNDIIGSAGVAVAGDAFDARIVRHAVAEHLGPEIMWLVAAEGVFYTFGAITYARRSPNPDPAVFGYHEIFHLCVVVASVLHYIAVWRIAV